MRPGRISDVVEIVPPLFHLLMLRTTIVMFLNDVFPDAHPVTDHLRRRFYL